MITTKIEICGSCSIEAVTWGDDFPPSVTIDYIVHGDYWHGDTETSVDVDKAKAIEIINLLKQTFGI